VHTAVCRQAAVPADELAVHVEVDDDLRDPADDCPPVQVLRDRDAQNLSGRKFDRADWFDRCSVGLADFVYVVDPIEHDTNRAVEIEGLPMNLATTG
jgi:hypothetical protein